MQIPGTYKYRTCVKVMFFYILMFFKNLVMLFMLYETISKRYVLSLPSSLILKPTTPFSHHSPDIQSFCLILEHSGLFSVLWTLGLYTNFFFFSVESVTFWKLSIAIVEIIYYITQAPFLFQFMQFKYSYRSSIVFVLAKKQVCYSILANQLLYPGTLCFEFV